MAASLNSSVSHLQSSLQLLNSSIDILDTAVSDFPRLSNVLQMTRHFELLPEPTLHEAQNAILDEITPSIAHLLSVVSNHIEKLGRREESLKAKSELQSGRLCRGNEQPISASSATSHSSSSSKVRGGGGVNSNKIMKRTRQQHQQSQQELNAASRAAEFRRLVQRKERLKYTVERLEMEARQNERFKRKSMAFQ